MKQLPLILKSILVFAFCIIFYMQAFSQNTGNDYLLKFNRKCTGNVASLNEKNEKVFTFVIENMLLQEQIENFIEILKGHELVISVDISEIHGDKQQRNATVILKPESKINDFQDLLRLVGVNTIFLDGELIAVDDLENKK
ncbi:MAG: hypothetical protein PHR81_04100 [Bacteroidales bacterium]|jgi:hypothetical protein|nr:hypothetical protein [Bacteroidales bacterium]MDD4213974.1 hypothetical protein [Bacteroidales bacterium]